MRLQAVKRMSKHFVTKSYRIEFQDKIRLIKPGDSITFLSDNRVGNGIVLKTGTPGKRLKKFLHVTYLDNGKNKIKSVKIKDIIYIQDTCPVYK